MQKSFKTKIQHGENKVNISTTLRNAMRFLFVFALLATVIGGAVLVSTSPVFAAPNGATWDATSYVSDMTAAGHVYSFIARAEGSACNGAYLLVPADNRGDQKISFPVVGDTMVTFAKGEWSAESVDVATAVTYSTNGTQRIALIDTGDKLSGGFEIRYCSDVSARERFGVGVNTPASEATADWTGNFLYSVTEDGERLNTYWNSVHLTTDGTSLSNVAITDNVKVTAYLGNGYTDDDMIVNLGTCNTSPCTWTAPANTTFASQGFGSYVSFKVEPKDSAAVYDADTTYGIIVP